jgi:hypothetical protein
MPEEDDEEEKAQDDPPPPPPPEPSVEEDEAEADEELDVADDARAEEIRIAAEEFDGWWALRVEEGADDDDVALEVGDITLDTVRDGVVSKKTLDMYGHESLTFLSWCLTNRPGCCQLPSISSWGATCCSHLHSGWVDDGQSSGHLHALYYVG